MVQRPLVGAESVPCIGLLDLGENLVEPRSRDCGPEDVGLHRCDAGFGVELLGSTGVESYPAGHVGHQTVAACAHHGHGPAPDRGMGGQGMAEVAAAGTVAQEHERLGAYRHNAGGQL